MPPKDTKPRAPAPPPHGETENDRPTISPPFDVEAFARASAAKPMPLDDPREQQITLTDEAELEAARAASAQPTEPPARRPSALAIADARIPNAPGVAAPPPRSTTPASIEAAVLSAIGSGPEITERTIEDPVAEMRERFALGDYTGALEMAELLLAEEPGNVEAAECERN